MRIKRFVAAIAILSTHGAAIAAEPQVMTPTGPWNVQFADKMCVLSRPYGADQDTRLVFKPSMLGNDLEIIVAKATTTPDEVVDGKVRLSVTGSEAPFISRYRAYSTKTHRLLRLWINEEKFPLAVVRGTLQIDAKSAGRYSFALPGIDKATPVLASCLAQLRTAYKISAADLAPIATNSESNFVSLFSTDDYPEDALSEGMGGTVGVLYWIEASGRVSSCEVVESDAPAIFEKTTCDVLIERARFKPAMDAAGRAIRSPTFGRVRWQPWVSD